MDLDQLGVLTVGTLAPKGGWTNLASKHLACHSALV